MQVNAPTATRDMTRPPEPTMRRAATAVVGLRRGGLALADQAVVSAANFVSVVIIGRTCTSDALGLYVLGFTLVVLATGVLQSLVCTPFMVDAASLSNDDRRVRAGSALMQAGVIALLVVICLGGSALVLWLVQPASAFTPVLLVLAVTAPLVLLREFVRRFEFAALHVGRALAVDAVAAGLQVGGLWVLISRSSLSPANAHACLGLACGAPALVWLACRYSAFRFDRRQWLAHFEHALALGKWMFATSMTSIASAYAMQWLLCWNAGPAATGTWAACVTLTDLSNPFLLAICNLIGPAAAHALAAGGALQMRRLVLRITLLTLVVMSGFAATLMLFGDQILALLYGARYDSDGFLLAVLAWSALCVSLGAPLNEGFAALRQPRIGLVTSLAGLLTMLLIAVVLMPTLGLLGAAFALLSGAATSAVLRHWLFWRTTASMLEVAHA
jgi:O-antigen/teichoic acid export membrane protein